jgi:hypothetical protein
MGAEFPVFPVRTGNFIDFPRVTVVLAVRRVRQIKPLRANSRSSANRELAPAEPGIKLAEPGVLREMVGLRVEIT